MIRFLFVRHDGKPLVEYMSLEWAVFSTRYRTDGVLIASSRGLYDGNVPFTEILSGVVACKNYCAIFGLTY